MSDETKTPTAYVVLQQYMVEGLGLTGDELIVYAIIYGFCLDGRSACRCTREYFSFWLGKSKTTVCRVIDSLCAKGYIVRDHEIVNGQTMPRYRLAGNAPRLKLDRVALIDKEDPAHGEGGTPTYPPHHDRETRENGHKASSVGGCAHVPPVRPRTGGTPVVTNTETDTDTETDSVSVSARGGEEKLRDEFNALRECVPNTDGFSYGFANYKALRERGYGFDEIARAARKATEFLRSEYPRRAAQYFPHAERFLSPNNAQGACGFLRKMPADEPVPSDAALYRFCISHDLGSLTREAIALNDAIVRAGEKSEKEEARSKKASWFVENRAALVEAWRGRKKGSA